MLLYSTALSGATITSNATGNWNVGGTWVGGVVPVSADNVIIAGGHTVTLTAGITRTGSLTVTGTLQLAGFSMTSGDLQGAGIVTSSSGVPILTTGSNNTSTTFSGVIGTGAIALTKNGTGTLTLSGSNTYTGLTTIAAGTLKLDNTTALGTTAGATSVTSGAVLDLNGINYSSAETLTLNGTGISTGGALINSNATDAAYAGNIALGGTAPRITANNPITLSGVISGTTDLTSAGTSVLTLSGANTNSGLNNISGGTLKLGNPAALGSVAAADWTWLNAGGVLDLNGLTTSTEFLRFNGGNLINSSGTTATYAGQIDIYVNTTTVTCDNPIIFSGVVAGNPTPGYTKNGTNTLKVTSDNNTRGYGIIINQGTLIVGTNGAIGSSTGNPVVVNGGAVLDLNGVNYTYAKILTLNGTGISGGGALINSSVTAATFGNTSSTITLGSASSVVGDAGTIAITGTITGATFGLTLGGAAGGSVTSIIGGAGTTVTKTDAGTWTLSGLNTYTGTTTVTAGILKATNNTIVASTNGAFGNNASGLLLNGGTIQSNVATFSRPITVTATGSGLDAYGATRTISSTITNSTASSTFNINVGGTFVTSAEGQNLTLSGVISNSAGTLSLTKLGTSVLTLSAANTFLGGAILSAGQLNINHATAPGSGAFTMNGGVIDNTTAGSITLSNNNTQNWNGDFTFTGTRSLDMGTGAVTLSASRQITVSSNTLTVGGTINQSTLNLAKSGSGTLSFGSQTITLNNLTISSGILTAPSGTLNLAGNFTNSATFTHNSGAVNFNGGSSQTIGGTTFNNLSIDNASGVTLSANVTYNATLTLGSGVIATGANTLIASSTGIVSRTNGHVYGNFQKNIATGVTSKTFEIGDVGNYAPITVDFASVTTAGNLTASTIAGDHPNIGSSVITATNTANRNWTLINSGIVFTTYNATFTFVAGDLDAGAATSNFIVGRYNAGWTYPTVGTKTSTSTQATGLTLFGDFQLGQALVTKIFTGIGNFSDATRWTSGTLPAIDDNLIIDGACTVDNNVGTDNVGYGTLTIGTATGRTLNWAPSGTNRLNVSNVSAGAGASALDMTNEGTMIIRGTWISTNLTFTPGAGTIEMLSTITLPAAYSTYSNLTINGSGSTVSSGTVTAITGNITISSGTFDANGFNLTIGGNWTNNSTFTPGTSTVTLNGSGAQTISGSSTTAFYDLTVNKAAGTATALVAFNVDNNLNLTQGVLTIESTSLYIFKNLSSSSGTTFNQTPSSPGAAYVTGDLAIDGTYNALYNCSLIMQNAGGVNLIRTGTCTGANVSGLIFNGISFLFFVNGDYRATGATSCAAIAYMGNATAGTFETQGYTATFPITIINGGSLLVNAGGGGANGILNSTFPGWGIRVGYVNSAGSMSVASGSTVNASQINVGYDATNTGTVSHSGGTVNTGDITIESGSSYTCSNSPLINVTGNWTNNGGTFTPGSSLVVFNGTVAQAIGGSAVTTFNNLSVSSTNTVTSSVNSDVAGDLLLTSGTLHLGSFTANRVTPGGTLTVSSGARLEIGGTNTLPSNYTTHSIGATSTIEYGGSVQSVVALNSAQDYGNLIISGSGTKTLAGTEAVTGNLTISADTFDLGANTINRTIAGGILTVSNGAALKIGGTNTLSSNYTTHSIGATSTIEYGGTTQSVAVLNSAQNYGNLIISGSGTKTLAGTEIVAGDLTVSGGTFDIGTNTINRLAAGGTLTVSNTATLRIGSTNTIPSSYFTHSIGATSTIEYGGTNQIVAVLNTSQDYGHLTISGSGTKTLAGNVNVGGTLTFTSGTITTGAGTLYVNSTGTVSRTSGHLIGNFKKYVSLGATSKTFEVGDDAGNYTPVTTAFASVTTTGDLTASVALLDHSNIGTSFINPSKSVNRNWTLVNSGIVFTNYSATFTFVAGDVDGGANTAAFIVGNYNGSWSYPTVGTRTSTTTQATGLTAFGDFQLGEIGTRSFTGTGNFSDAVRWTGGTLPGAGDNLIIDGTCSVDTNAGTDNVAYGTLRIGTATGRTLNWATGGTNRLNVSNVSASAGASSLDMTNGGSLIVRGTWVFTNLSFTPGAGTVEVQSTITLPAAYPTYNNLSVNGSGTTVSLNANTTVMGNVTITSGTLNSNNFDLSVGGNWTNNASNTAFTAGTAGQTFNGTGAQAIGGTFPTTFTNITIDKPIGISTTFTGNIVIDGDLTISSGTLNVQTYTCNRSSMGGTATLTDSGTIIIGADNWPGFFSTYALANSSTVIFDGPSPQLLPGIVFGDLTLSNTGAKTLVAPMTVNGDLTIANGTVFDSNSNTITINGDWINDGGTYTPGSTTVTFSGTGAQSITGTSASHTFNNIIISKSPGTLLSTGGSTLALTTNDFTQTTGNFTAPATLNINGDMLLSAGTFTAGAIINIAGDWTYDGGTFTPGSNVVGFNGAGAQSIAGSSTTTFHNLAISGTNTVTSAVNAAVSGDLLLSSGTLHLGSFTANRATPGGTLTVSNGAELEIGSTNTLPSNYTTHSIGATSTIEYSGTVQSVPVLNTIQDYGNLIISGSGTKTLAGDENVAGDLTIDVGTFDLGASGLAVTGSVSIISAGTLNANSLNFPVGGNWINDGTFNASTGTVAFVGTSTQTMSGSSATNFNNVTVSNTASPGVSVQNNQNLSGVLTLAANVVFDADGTGNTAIFRLISASDSPTQDAGIAALPSGAQVTGNVTAQRYMAIEGPNSGRIYRYIASPLQNATVADIQVEIPIAGSFTGSSGGSSQSMFGYDESVITDTNGSGSADLADGYVDFPNASNAETLVPGKGYAMFVRGDQIGSALWDVRGTITSGNVSPVSLPVTYTSSGAAADDGWNLVGNPFPSTIDWNAAIGWTKNNMEATIYIRDNGVGNAQVATWNGTVGVNGGSRNIAAGQGFWVKADGGGIPLLQANENVKAAGTQTTFFREGAPDNLLRITIVKGIIRDEVVIHFRDDATEGFDKHADARKLSNSAFNLSSLLEDNNYLAINSLPTLGCNSTVKLSIDYATPGSYQLQFSEFGSFPEPVSIVLLDNFTNTTFDVKGGGAYDFSVSTNPASYGAGRLEMTFALPELHSDFLVNVSTACDGSAMIRIDNSQQGVTYVAMSEHGLLSQPVTGNGETINLVIPGDSSTTGQNNVTIKSAWEGCSVRIEKSAQFNVVKKFEITSTEGGKSCREGVMTLQATGAPEDGYYNWYESESSSLPLTGQHTSSFTTPSLLKSKTYYVSIVNSLNCEGLRKSILAEVIQFDDAQIKISGDSLQSNFANGNQWYFNHQIIPQATTQSILPDQSGTYSVEVSIDGCLTSVDYDFVVTGMESPSSMIISVFPNPIIKDVNITVPDSYKSIERVEVINAVGQAIGIIELQHVNNMKRGSFDMTDCPAGIYMLRAVGSEKTIVVKVIKQ